LRRGLKNRARRAQSALSAPVNRPDDAGAKNAPNAQRLYHLANLSRRVIWADCAPPLRATQKKEGQKPAWGKNDTPAPRFPVAAFVASSFAWFLASSATGPALFGVRILRGGNLERSQIIRFSS